MAPVVLIATHQRLEITSINIDLLLKQNPTPRIVIVVSDINEIAYYNKNFPVTTLLASNAPLGYKWQFGVDYIRKNMSISHLIITGSDDILCKDFIQRFCVGVPFVGLQKWYIWNGLVLYLFDYLANQCLGGGRVYSLNMLNSYGWQIFNTSANKLLDDKGWEATNPATRVIIKTDGCILAVKGNWPVLNPLHVTLKHKNAGLISKHTGVEAKQILLNKFNYNVS